MLKTISIVLSEKMIQEINEALFDTDFSSRSEFFRHLVRMWFHNLEHADLKNVSRKEPKNKATEVELEFGIPLGVIEEIKEKAKLLN